MTLMPEPSVNRSIQIAASRQRVWRALIEPESIARWMLNAKVTSTWKPGSEISFIVEMPGHEGTFHDRGTVLAVEDEILLRYSHWSQASRLPDLPENRSMIAFTLDPFQGQTLLTVHHDHFPNEASYKHARFFWNYALHDLKTQLES